MSAVKDLSKLPIGTKVEMIANGEVIHTLHTTSLYKDFQYILVDENENKLALTIKELMWGSYEIHFPKSAVEETPYQNLENQYNLMRGQILIVKEMSAPNIIGGVIYDTEMELVEIIGKHIIVQELKGTSTLTGGVAEYCFSIDEIGKTIIPK